MRCTHCNKPLTEDSRFCRFCGTAAPDKPKTYIVTDVAHCRSCGKPIDSDSRRCTGCGKQSFRGVRPTAFLCIVLALALLAMTALTLVLTYRFRADNHAHTSSPYTTSLSTDSTSENAINVPSFI